MVVRTAARLACPSSHPHTRLSAHCAGLAAFPSAPRAPQKLQVRLRARLDHVASLAIPLDYTYAFKVKCASCNEQHDKPVELTRTVRRGRRRNPTEWLHPGAHRGRRTRRTLLRPLRV